MKAKEQVKDITRHKEANNLKNLEKIKDGTRRSHSVSYQVDLQLT